jgi:hypothetical protein
MSSLPEILAAFTERLRTLTSAAEWYATQPSEELGALPAVFTQYDGSRPYREAYGRPAAQMCHRIHTLIGMVVVGRASDVTAEAPQVAQMAQAVMDGFDADYTLGFEEGVELKLTQVQPEAIEVGAGQTPYTALMLTAEVKEIV